MMARVCEACGVAVTTGKYYDVMVVEKDPQESPEQSGEGSYGDFCRACLESGAAVRYLLGDEPEGETDADSTTDH